MEVEFISIGNAFGNHCDCFALFVDGRTYHDVVENNVLDVVVEQPFNELYTFLFGREGTNNV